MPHRRFSVLVPALAVLASLTLSHDAMAQRHSRRTRHMRHAHAHHVAATQSPPCTTAACSDDYSLEIVASLFPYDDGVVRGPGVLTLVVENRGSAPAPAFSVDVAQRTRFASLSRSPVGMLAPGERAVVQIPLEMGPDGAPCVAVTLDTWNVSGPPPQFYATASAPVPPASPMTPIATVAEVASIASHFGGR